MEKITITIEERHHNTICEIECSEMYNRMLETGDYEYILRKFNEAISILSMRIRKGKCQEEFSDAEADVLGFVLGLIEDE